MAKNRVPSLLQYRGSVRVGPRGEVVEVAEHCNYPALAVDEGKTGGFSTPDMERMIVLQPDLIPGGSINVEEVVPALEDFAWFIRREVFGKPKGGD
jgi:ABC-type Fe3+-hydroxamate transport system substrate-binding protein